MRAAHASAARRSDLGPVAAVDESAYEFARLDPVDYSLANDLYNQCYPFRPIEEADWLYRQNPWGPSLIWGAFTGEGRLVGMRPAIPWRFFGSGGQRPAYQLVDALVAPDHRGRGLFRRLMTHTLDWAARRRVTLFSFPNESSLAAYRAMGELQVVDRCHSEMKVLRWPRFVRTRLTHDHSAVIGSDPTPAVLVDGDITMKVADRFDGDLSPIHVALARHHFSFTLREPRFLNWRYRSVPGRSYIILLVTQAGHAQGHLVIRMKDGIAYLVDVFIRPLPDLLARVGRLLAVLARDLGTSAICFRTSENDLFAHILGHGALVKNQVQTVAMDSRSLARFSNPYFVMGDSDVW